MSAATAFAAGSPRDGLVVPGLDASLWSDPLPRVAWEDVLDELRLEFFDAATEQTFTAHGPYVLVREGDDQVEVRAASTGSVDAPLVTLIQTSDGLWAVARFDDREFATRIK